MQEGWPSAEIARQLGVRTQTVAAIKAHRTMGTYREVSVSEQDEDDLSEEAGGAIESEDAEMAEITFGLERDLQCALRSHLQQLERGLRMADSGKEKIIPSGRVDITAEDEQGRLVVIELKAGEADRDAIGQIASYMGDLTTKETPVRGVLVAADFTARAVSAARAIPNLKLKKYAFQFAFSAVDSNGCDLPATKA